MGADLSFQYQEVEVTSNRKWLHLPGSGVYINVTSVAFFAVRPDPLGRGSRIMFRLAVTHTPETEEHLIQEYFNTFQTVVMSQQQVGAVIAALTQ